MVFHPDKLHLTGGDPIIRLIIFIIGFASGALLRCFSDIKDVKIYMLCKILTGISFLLAFDRFGLTVDFLSTVILLSCLIISAFIDIYYGIIPDRILLPTFILGLMLKLISFDNILDNIFGLILGGGTLLLLYSLYQGSIGEGDIKLFSVVGWFLGSRLTLLSLLISFILAGIVGMILVLLRIKSLKDTIPFGPFIAFGSFISLFFHEMVLSLYLI